MDLTFRGFTPRMYLLLAAWVIVSGCTGEEVTNLSPSVAVAYGYVTDQRDASAVAGASILIEARHPGCVDEVLASGRTLSDAGGYFALELRSAPVTSYQACLEATATPPEASGLAELRTSGTTITFRYERDIPPMDSARVDMALRAFGN